MKVGGVFIEGQVKREWERGVEGGYNQDTLCVCIYKIFKKIDKNILKREKWSFHPLFRDLFFLIFLNVSRLCVWASLTTIIYYLFHGLLLLCCPPLELNSTVTEESQYKGPVLERHLRHTQEGVGSTLKPLAWSLSH